MNEDKLSLIHQAARAEFDQIQGAMYQERMNCLGDRRFCSLAGAQWEGPLGDQFGFFVRSLTYYNISPFLLIAKKTLF